MADRGAHEAEDQALENVVLVRKRNLNRWPEGWEPAVQPELPPGCHMAEEHPTNQLPFIEVFLPAKQLHYGRHTHSVSFFVPGVPKTSRKAVSRPLALAACANWAWEWHSLTAGPAGAAASSSSGADASARGTASGSGAGGAATGSGSASSSALVPSAKKKARTE